MGHFLCFINYIPSVLFHFVFFIIKKKFNHIYTYTDLLTWYSVILLNTEITYYIDLISYMEMNLKKENIIHGNIHKLFGKFSYIMPHAGGMSYKKVNKRRENFIIISKSKKKSQIKTSYLTNVIGQRRTEHFVLSLNYLRIYGWCVVECFTNFNVSFSVWMILGLVRMISHFHWLLERSPGLPRDRGSVLMYMFVFYVNLIYCLI